MSLDWDLLSYKSVAMIRVNYCEVHGPRPRSLPSSPSTQIVDTVAPKYPYRDYFKA